MAVALLAILAGLALVVVASVLNRVDQDASIAEVLGLPRAVAVDDVQDSRRVVTDRAVDLAGQAVERVDGKRSLDDILDRARIPLRPGEFVIVVIAGALGLSALALLFLGSALLAIGGGVGGILLTGKIVRRRVAKRRKAFSAQLPDALSLVASSLSAGHTFLRAVQMMCEESAAPLSEEFGRLVAETRLGYNVTEALDRMAQRLQIRDLDMVVQAIRIQQTVGGKLADLFHTLSDVIRARDEVKREVQILTAEGRMSAYVLAALVPLLYIMMRIMNPAYMRPLNHAPGLYILIACAASVTAGLLVILRMVKIDV